MLGEGEGQRGRKLEPGEVVAICDHLGSLGGRELEEKIRKPIAVAAYLLIEPLGGNAVELGEVGVDHDLVASHDDDASYDLRGDGHGNGRFRCLQLAIA